jgi:hypothetical protein
MSSTAAAHPRHATGHIIAGRPVGPTSGWGIQHLFDRPGEWSLCGEAVWLQCIRATDVNHLTWICYRCQRIAAGLPDQEPLWATADRLEAVKRGECPNCRGPLADPSLSPERWRHCRECRVGWIAQQHVRASGVIERVARRDWPRAAPK